MDLPQMRDLSHLHSLVQSGALRTVLDRKAYDRIAATQQKTEARHPPLESIHLFEFNYDFVVENQRGWSVFGIPLFSKASLIHPFDPPGFQAVGSKAPGPSSLNHYPLPDLLWEWAWDSWSVLMNSDVDDQGWVYLGFVFQLSLWHGKVKLFNFVRRRVWVRLRAKPFLDSDPGPIDGAYPADMKSRSRRTLSRLRPSNLKRRPKPSACSVELYNNDLQSSFSAEAAGESEVSQNAFDEQRGGRPEPGTSLKGSVASLQDGPETYDAFLDRVGQMGVDREKIEALVARLLEGHSSDLCEIQTFSDYLELLTFAESIRLLTEKLQSLRGIIDAKVVDEVIENVVLLTTDAV